MTIDDLNSLPASAAKDEFRKCCGCDQWAAGVLAARPFANLSELKEAADRVWWSLEPQDWLEAFHSHPRIGEKNAVAATSEQSRQWAEGEQAGVARAASSTLQMLAELNQRYEDKFGYIFIVCATGKSSEEMLDILRARLGNDPEDELRLAAAEQAKITALRLDKVIKE